MTHHLNVSRLHEALPLSGTPRVWAVIDRNAVADNYRTLLDRVRAVSPDTDGIAVVKADAYGHGIRPVVSTLLSVGCHSFAVACTAEALALRSLLRELLPPEQGDRPFILILGHTDPDDAATLAAHAITATLVSDAHAAALESAAHRAGVLLSVHAALDTGMNRIGYPARSDTEIAQTIDRLLAQFHRVNATVGLSLDGLFTHFARADEDYGLEMTASDSLTEIQYDRYRRVVDGLSAKGLRPRLCHICNSAAAVRFPVAHPDRCFDAVRLGINLYGYGVSPTDGQSTRPVMRLCTRVSHVHDLPPGETVGYGGTFSADTPKTLVTLPIGYADGWIRALTGASVTLHTTDGLFSAPIVGRICMDQCMVDITDLPAAARASITPGTRVTLFGLSAHELEALASHAQTISYELLCLITARVPRVW